MIEAIGEPQQLLHTRESPSLAKDLETAGSDVISGVTPPALNHFNYMPSKRQL
jgi:hypothetical protein